MGELKRREEIAFSDGFYVLIPGKKNKVTMATVSIDTSELEYLKSCRDKLRDIGEILEKDEGDDEEKLKEIKRTMEGKLSPHKPR